MGGSVKVADFGLARVLEHSTTGHTGAMTPHYAPPEFFEQKTMSQSDQYSLAVTYCQLRGGRLPFEGHPAAVISGHLYRDPDLSMLPEGERRAVARALEKPSRERWQSCRAFVQAVMAVEGREAPPTAVPVDSSWRRTTFPDTHSSGPPTKPDPLSELSPAAPRSRMRSVYKLGKWALVAAVLLIAAILLFRRDKPAEVVASKTPGPDNPTTKSSSTAERPGNESTRPASKNTIKRPDGELTKPVPPLDLAVAKPEKNTMAIRALVDRGLSFLAAGDSEKAMAEFDEAIRLDPGNAEAHAGRSLANDKRGDNKQRLADADEAVRLDPRSALAHAARGSCFFPGPSSDFSTALAEADEAVRLDPSNALGHAVRAKVYIARYWKNGEGGDPGRLHHKS